MRKNVFITFSRKMTCALVSFAMIAGSAMPVYAADPEGYEEPGMIVYSEDEAAKTGLPEEGADNDNTYDMSDVPEDAEGGVNEYTENTVTEGEDTGNGETDSSVWEPVLEDEILPGDELLDAPVLTVTIQDIKANRSKGIPAVNKLWVSYGIEVPYVIEPAELADKVTVSVSSSDKTIVDVNTSNNLLFPLLPGNADITVTAKYKPEGMPEITATSEPLTVTSVYPVGTLFESYGKRFATSEDQLYTGWLTYSGGKYTQKKGKGVVYYLKDVDGGTSYRAVHGEQMIDGVTYLFNDDCELVKEWAKLKEIKINDIEAGKESGAIDLNTLPFGNSYNVVADLVPDFTNDSIDPEWRSDNAAVRVVSEGEKDGKVYARLDVLENTDDPVNITLEAGETYPDNRKSKTLTVYVTYPVGWHTIAGRTYYGLVVDDTPRKKVVQATGWVDNIDGKKYYFKESGNVGEMVTGIYEVDGVKYDFGEDGACRGALAPGFVKTKEGTVYYDGTGFVSDMIVHDEAGNSFYIGPDGFLRSGYFEALGGHYYGLSEGFPEGMLQSGWVLIDGAWHLFDDPGAASAYAELSSTSADANGWIHIPSLGKRYYRLPKGKFLSGWKTIDGNKYYFESDGSVATGPKKIGNSEYYFGQNSNWNITKGVPSPGDDFGIMKKGRVTFDGKFYFYNTSGIKKTGWQKTGEVWDYYDPEDGHSLNAVKAAGGWYSITFDGKQGRYYFTDNKTLATGWQTIGESRYYFDTKPNIYGSVGQMATGTVTVGSEKYYFSTSSGKLMTGDFFEGGHAYSADENGVLKLGWHRIDNVWKFYDPATGQLVPGAVTVGADNWVILYENSHYHKYYFKDGKTPVTGLQTIDGRKYYFGADKNSKDYGRVLSGLCGSAKARYFGKTFDDTNQAAVKDPSAGELLTGWIDEYPVIGLFYADQKGVVKSGWQTIEGVRYYFDTDTYLLQKGITKIGKNTYILDKTDGHMQTGYIYLDGSYYLTNKSGVMQFGYCKKNETSYGFFDPDPESATYGKELTLTPWTISGTPAGFYMADGTENGRIVAVIKNKLQKGWKTIDGRKYYFDQYGVLQMGGFTVGKQDYYSYTILDAGLHPALTGSVYSGSRDSIYGKVYYDKNGRMVTGWVKIGDGYYYYDTETGCLRSGMFSVKNKTYITDATGKRQTGIVTFGLDKYYLDRTGAVKKGWQNISEGGVKNRYYFDAAGRMVDGITKVGNKKYIFDHDGVLLRNYYGSLYGLGGRYASDNGGALLTGWQNIKKAAEPGWRYFDVSAGKEVTVDIKEVIDGYTWHTLNIPDGGSTRRAKFCFSKRGKLLKGWQNIGSRRYYFDKTGQMAVGTYMISKKPYYFTEAVSDSDKTLEGSLISNGIVSTSGKYYYMKKTGEYQKGWFTVDGNRYYSDPDTGELTTGFFSYDEKTYYFSELKSTIGQLQTGFVSIPRQGQPYIDETPGASNMYYADENGVIVKSGWREIKHDPKVKNSQEWSFYFAPNRPGKDLGTFTLTGELAVGDVLIEDNGDVTYLDDGRGADDGYPSSGTQISKYYRFDPETGARRKEVLYFYGNYYGAAVDDNQKNTVASMRRYINSDMMFASESDDFVIVNGESNAKLVEKGLTSYPSATFPMCASFHIADEKRAYKASSDIAKGPNTAGIDQNVDVWDVELYTKDVYDKAVKKYGPNNLVLMGASSGAGICLGLYEHAVSKGDPNMLPKQVILLSPWLDVSMSNPDCTSISKRHMGTTDVETLKYWGARYTRDADYVDTDTGKKEYELYPGAGVGYKFATSLNLSYDGMNNIDLYAGTYDPCIFDCIKFAKEAQDCGCQNVIMHSYSGKQHGFMFYNDSGKSVINEVCRKVMTR